MTVSWLYHVSSVLSTPPQAGPGSLLSNRGNCLQINCKNENSYAIKISSRKSVTCSDRFLFVQRHVKPVNAAAPAC